MENITTIHQAILSRQQYIASDFDAIEKSDVVDAFRYDSNIKITKTGKQLKEALSKVRETYESEKNQLAKQMNECLKQCTIAPTQDPSEYIFRGYKSQMIFIPKMFSYKECSERVESSINGENTTTQSEQSKCCDQYNSCAEKYIRKCVDVLFLDTLKNGLGDNEKYSLNMQQAAVLGF